MPIMPILLYHVFIAFFYRFIKQLSIFVLYNKFIWFHQTSKIIKLYKQIMTASADKVQFMLEACLEDCLPFVKKGIFTTEELRDMMNQREKHQNSMMKSTFKLSDYLKAIEYQYTIERLRLHRIKNTAEDNVNPLFKKQAKTDFAIIKRILRLWDRTMHKYKYRAYLWKQYMAFCIAIKSKKHFYKALTNALRFLPFQVDLWKIGVRYQVQVGMNMWKARKIFYKGLKMIPAGLKNIELSKQFLKFQIQFVQKLQARQKIIKGQQLQENNMKFIMPEGNYQNQNQNQADSQNDMMIDQEEQLKNLNNFNNDNIKLQEYHEIFNIICVQAIEKNSKITKEIDQIITQQKLETMKKVKLHQLTEEFIDYLMELFGQNRQDVLIAQILMKCVEGLKKYKNNLVYEKLIKIQQEKPLNSKTTNNLILQEEQIQAKEKQNKNRSRILNNSQNVQDWVEEIMQKYSQQSKFDKKLFSKAVRTFCLRPNLLQNLLTQLLEMQFDQTLKNLILNSTIKLPLQSLKIVLQNLNNRVIQQTSQQIQKYLNLQIQKIDVLDYRQNIKVLEKVIEYNKKLNQIQQNNKIYRSIMVQGKKFVEFSERAKAMFVQKK